MKKIVSIFISLFLASSSLSFAESSIYMETCGEWADAMVTAEEDAYGAIHDINEYWHVHRWYMNACNKGGGAGNMSDPVFL